MTLRTREHSRALVESRVAVADAWHVQHPALTMVGVFLRTAERAPADMAMGGGVVSQHESNADHDHDGGHCDADHVVALVRGQPQGVERPAVQLQRVPVDDKKRQ